MKRLSLEAPLHACQIFAILGIARRHLGEGFSRMSNPDRRDAAMSVERLDDCLSEGAELWGVRTLRPGQLSRPKMRGGASWSGPFEQLLLAPKCVSLELLLESCSGLRSGSLSAANRRNISYVCILPMCFCSQGWNVNTTESSQIPVGPQG